MKLSIILFLYGVSRLFLSLVIDRSSTSNSQTTSLTNDRERLALDISTLKQQYAKLRERQRQAHIILSGTYNNNLQFKKIFFLINSL